jgi:hypothetical protein
MTRLHLINITKRLMVISPFDILRLFWLPPLVSSDFSHYPLWYPQIFLIFFYPLKLTLNKTFNGHIYQPDEQCQHYRNGSSYLCRVSLRVLIMKMVVSKSKCVFWLPPLVSSDFSDYPLWYPQTFLITPFGILRLFSYSHYRNGSSYLCRVSLKSVNNENGNCTRSSQCQNV